MSQFYLLLYRKRQNIWNDLTRNSGVKILIFELTQRQFAEI